LVTTGLSEEAISVVTLLVSGGAAFSFGNRHNTI
jgi:hypothetical protein